MGGKDKKGQRTKGNLQPSSSGRSAELLGHPVGFVGFGGPYEGSFTSAPLGRTTFFDDVQSFSLPPDFQVIIKKMSKKDVTTKTKAIQEFITLCDQSTIDALKVVLPFWPRIYSRLALDDDQKVREYIQKANSSFVNKLGRETAPYLKEFVGVWFTSQCDIYSPAASASTAALNLRFPNGKLNDFVVFFHKDILNYINESLPRNDLTDDQRERLLVECFGGYSLLLQLVKPDSLSSDDIQSQHSNLWKSTVLYQKAESSNSVLVKQAWFVMLSKLFQFLPSIAEENLKIISKSFSRFLNDASSLSQPTLWITALEMFHTANNIWSFISFEKCFFPRLMELLNNACYGNAVAIGPVVCSFVRLFYEKQIQFDKEKLNRGVIQGFSKGLLSRNASSSPSESSALATALFQVISYVAFKQDLSSNCLELMDSEVMGVYRSLIDSRTSEKTFQIFLRNFVKCVIDWFSYNEEFAAKCFDLLSSHIIGLMSQTPHPSSQIVSRIVLTITILRNPHDKKESSKVSFRPLPSESEKKPVENSIAPEPTQTMPPGLVEKIAEFCRVLGAEALKCFQQLNCRDCLQLVSSLIDFDEFSNTLHAAVEDPLPVLQCLLGDLNGQDDSCAAYTFFKLLKSFDSPNRGLSVEDVLKHADDTVWLRLAVPALKDKRIYKIDVAKGWLRGERLSHLFCASLELVNIPNEEVDNEDENYHWEILKGMLQAQVSDQEPVVKDDVLRVVIGNLSNGIGRENLERMERHSMQIYLLKVSEAFKNVSPCVCSGDSLGMWCDNLIALLCSNEEMDLELFENLLDTWRVNSSSKSRTSCCSAISTVRETLLQRTDRYGVDKIVRVLHEVFNLAPEDDSFIETLNHELILGLEKTKRKISESAVFNLMAADFLNGDFFPASPSSIYQFKAYKINYWISFLKLSLICTTTALHYPVSDDDRDDAIICALFASEAVHIVSKTLAKLYQETSEMLGLEDNLKSLEDNVKQLLEKSHNIEEKMAKKCETSELKYLSHLSSVMVKKIRSIVNPSDVEEKQQETKLDLNSIIFSNLEQLKHEEPLKKTESRDVLTSIRKLLQQEKASESLYTLADIMKVAREWRDNFHDELLFGADLKADEMVKLTTTEQPWTVLEVMRIYQVVIERYGSELDSGTWDLILCSVSSWCTTLEETWKNVTSKDYFQPILLSFTIALLRLVTTTAGYVKGLSDKGNEAGTESTTDIVSEWNDVFSEDIYHSIMLTFLSLPWKTDVNHPAFHTLYENIYSALQEIPANHVKASVDELAQILLAKYPGIQLAAYSLIRRLVPQIASSESECFKEEQKDDDNKPERLPPNVLMNIIEKSSLASLEEIRIGDVHEIKPYSAECSNFLGYCFSWNLVIHLCANVSSELRSQYATSLYTSDQAPQLLENLFRVIPHGLSSCNLKLDFSFLVNVPLASALLQEVAITTYASALHYLPALVRRWVNSVDKRTAMTVEKFTSKLVSPTLIDLDLQFTSKSWDNMSVKVRRNAREVVATYKLNEEASMELLIQLPPSYPLGNTVVESGRRVGVNSNQWRNWMLQLTTFLTHQNGSIIDGLALWKRNVDKRFEGVEECYICYYVLHGSNYQLPKLSCRTCKKKFHADCLYKWFNTSTNSTCPLCRNLF